MGDNPGQDRRRSIRLRSWDYTAPGAYFVTLCTHNRECLFEDPTLRQVVETIWRRIPRHFPQVQLDEFVVMSNHVHAIIWITDRVGWRPAHWGPSSVISNQSFTVPDGRSAA